MERKELKVIEADEADIKCDCYTQLLIKEEADAVMDVMEKQVASLQARIKELEVKKAELKYQIENFTQGALAATLEMKLYKANERIKELEEDNKIMSIQLKLLYDGCMPSGNAVEAELSKAERLSELSKDDSPATISFLDELEVRR